jgi:hypothetical protein
MNEPPIALEHMRPLWLVVWGLVGLGIYLVLAALAFGFYELAQVLT